ncbi:hypothetical protein PAMA_014995 [Pampus argenteus]
MGTDNITAPKSAGQDGTLTNLQITVLVFYCVIFVVGVVGNGLVIYVTGFRMKRTVNSVWFLNLALADFLFLLFLVFTIVSASQAYNWQFGRLMCQVNTFVNAMNMFASVFLLMAISLDRCLSILVVVWAQNKRTVRKAQLLCAAIWLTAAVCSTPFATFRDLKTNTKTKVFCMYSWSPTQKYSLVIFRFVMAFLIPFLVIIASYGAIGIRARRLQNTRKQRPCRVIISVILAFFFCWLPFHVICLLELKTDSPELKNVIRTGGPVTLILAVLNSCLNPLLYVFMYDEFQKKLKQSICAVFESALAEEHLSFTSSRSLSSHFSRISRKSDSGVSVERKGPVTSLTFAESRVHNTE